MTPTDAEALRPSAVMQAFEDRIARLQEEMAQAVGRIDGSDFRFQEWQRPEGGGGRMGMLHGEVVEKGACHVSRVWGPTNPVTGNPFRAAGLSLILHPRSPYVPTVHLNVRRFEEADGGWWGGGMDLTPMGVRHEEDVAHFHRVLQERLGDAYEAGRQAAADYFFVPHRGRERGAGGVFYDRYATDDDAADRAFMERVAESFFDAWLPILERHKDTPWDEAQRQQQCRERGVYVEFNLLYDLGTRFGFQSGGNVEAILSSLPPEVHWP